MTNPNDKIELIKGISIIVLCCIIIVGLIWPIVHAQNNYIVKQNPDNRSFVEFNLGGIKQYHANGDWLCLYERGHRKYCYKMTTTHPNYHHHHSPFCTYPNNNEICIFRDWHIIYVENELKYYLTNILPPELDDIFKPKQVMTSVRDIVDNHIVIFILKIMSLSMQLISLFEVTPKQKQLMLISICMCIWLSFCAVEMYHICVMLEGNTINIYNFIMCISVIITDSIPVICMLYLYSKTNMGEHIKKN